MDLLQEQLVTCPCCGETTKVLIDTSVERQTYTEDCQVCCQPVVFDITVFDDELRLDCWPENG